MNRCRAWPKTLRLGHVRHGGARTPTLSLTLSSGCTSWRAQIYLSYVPQGMLDRCALARNLANHFLERELLILKLCSFQITCRVCMDTPTLPSVLCANATAFLSNPSQLNGSHFRFSLFLSGLFSPIVCLSFCASLLCPPHTCCRSATRITPCRCISKKLPNKSAMQPVVQLFNYASPMSSTSRL